MNEKLKKILVVGGCLSVALNVALVCGIVHFAKSGSESERLATKLQRDVDSLTDKIKASTDLSGEIKRGNSELETAIGDGKDLVGKLGDENGRLGKAIGDSRDLAAGIAKDDRDAIDALDRGGDHCGAAEEANRRAAELIRECIDIVERDKVDGK
jgi:hypothetical protein